MTLEPLKEGLITYGDQTYDSTVPASSRFLAMVKENISYVSQRPFSRNKSLYDILKSSFLYGTSKANKSKSKLAFDLSPLKSPIA